MADLDAGATGTMPSALAARPDQAGARRTTVPGEARRGGGAYARILPLINYENRQCGLRATKTVMKEGGVIKSDAVRHPLEPMHPADARGAARARGRARRARAAVGQEQLTASALLGAARELSRSLAKLEFPAPVAHVYDPHQYAWAPYEAYVTRYGATPKRVVLLGMNPGPFGMMQTGVPFGEIAAVRDWMGIRAPVEQAEARASAAADRGLRLQALRGERPAAVGLGGRSASARRSASSPTGSC